MRELRYLLPGSGGARLDQEALRFLFGKCIRPPRARACTCEQCGAPMKRWTGEEGCLKLPPR